jgi:hypothetical protein
MPDPLDGNTSGCRCDSLLDLAGSCTTLIVAHEATR